MYRIGNEEIEAVKKVIESRSLFKINGGVAPYTISVYGTVESVESVGDKNTL